MKKTLAQAIPAPPFQDIQAEEGPWRLVVENETHDEHPISPGLRQLFIEAFPGIAQYVQQHKPMPEGTVGYVVVSGEQCAMDWNVDEMALGFNAVISSLNTMDEDSGKWSTQTMLANDFRCYINIDACVAAMLDDEDDKATRLSTLTTMSHEMAHTVELAEVLDGKTPWEVVNDAPTLAMGLDDLTERLEDFLGADMDDREDDVEEFGRQAVDHWEATAPNAPALLDGVDLTLTRAARFKTPGP